MNNPPIPIAELPCVGFLSEVSSEHRSFLACFGKFVRPKTGDILIAEGDRQESLYVILSGIQHIVSSVGGRQVLIASLGEGDSMGEINVFDPSKASATAISRSDGFVWSISREEFDAFMEADPVAGVAVLRGLLCEVAKRIRRMNEKVTTAEERASFHNSWSSAPQ
jgi:CRP-like cAMP-binding protein